MKKICLGLLVLFACCQLSYGQWTSGASDINNTNSGNVGIGTSNPRATLDVGKFLSYGELGSVLARLSEGNAKEGTYLGVRGYASQINEWNTEDSIKSFAIEHGFYNIINNSINFFRGGNTAGGYMTFNTDNNTEKMRITTSGNVGIGITNPQYKLAVNGVIHAREVKVDMNGWPDYVFKPEYRLPKLSEVASFIHKNQHLPEVPSAKQIEKEGVNLGEMNKLLLKKIEELTLHLIDKDEQLKEEKVANARQEDKLSLQERELTRQQNILSIQQKQLSDQKTAIDELAVKMKKIENRGRN